ncbi:Ubiquinol--cytochrome c reductase, cytochrome B subunit [Labilithrix luteola]|uniref:Ubiquinol--cytochrome c reductase, cytochrome B subunit n=1 Tax=Labilithrix luteola TaxID=1391654 RepID=A0A0K1PZI4_9BACT|nr:cytochrome b N-terminal domain-containing protein [Labilithrix luteola]AKU98945.1 Ubiquinol--cytochrome c reductase, cytochrome B subunit [Labilithrix luteola]
MSRLRRLGDFFDERTGYRKLLSHALEEPVRGGARWAYVFGSTLVTTFLVQAVTGMALMTSYAPSDKTAWASVHFITFVQAGGWLVRGMHSFGAQAMVILIGLHLLQVAFFGAYRKPREVNWWFGLVLLALTLGFALTGYLLPWDQKGYWATRVATNIAGTVPIVGDATQRLLLGGPEYGSLTLTRFYALHVVVLPALLVGALVAHVALFRKHGVTALAGADLRRVDTFFPKQLAKDLLASLLVLGIVIVLALVEHGAPLDAPADPASDYPARPEWYFLSLFQLLKYFHGPLEIVGTVVLPTLVAIYFVVLPLLDRRPTNAIRGRVGPLAPVVVVAVSVVVLTFAARYADAHDAAFQKDRAKADARSRAANRIALQGIPPEGPLAMMKLDPELRGPELFESRCASCHRLGTRGPKDEAERKAPVLDGWGTESWVLTMIHDPDADAKFGRTPYKGEMPSVDRPPPGEEGTTFKPMPEAEKLAVAAFLASQGDEPGDEIPKDALRRDPARVAMGREIVKGRCTTCHLFEGRGDDSDQGLAPELSHWGSYAWVRAQIENPSTKVTYREKALDADRKGHMPRFDGELRPEEITLLAKWVHDEARRTP